MISVEMRVVESSSGKNSGFSEISKSKRLGKILASFTRRARSCFARIALKTNLCLRNFSEEVFEVRSILAGFAEGGNVPFICSEEQNL